MRGAIPPLPLHVFMARCLLKHRATFYWLKVVEFGEAYVCVYVHARAHFSNINKFGAKRDTCKDIPCVLSLESICLFREISVSLPLESISTLPHCYDDCSKILLI
jgi:hypothetical protein